MIAGMASTAVTPATAAATGAITTAAASEASIFPRLTRHRIGGASNARARKLAAPRAKEPIERLSQISVAEGVRLCPDSAAVTIVNTANVRMDFITTSEASLVPRAGLEGRR